MAGGARADDGVRAYGKRRPLRRDTLRGPGSHVLWIVGHVTEAWSRCDAMEQCHRSSSRRNAGTNAAPIFSRAATVARCDATTNVVWQSGRSRLDRALTADSVSRIDRQTDFSSHSSKVLPFRVLTKPALNGTKNFHALNFQHSRRTRDLSSLLSSFFCTNVQYTDKNYVGGEKSICAVHTTKLFCDIIKQQLIFFF